MYRLVLYNIFKREDLFLQVYRPSYTRRSSYTQVYTVQYCDFDILFAVRSSASETSTFTTSTTTTSNEQDDSDVSFITTKNNICLVSFRIDKLLLSPAGVI